MTSSANSRGFSRMGVDPTVSGLVDGTDFPHSALFHALNIATQGSYAIIDGNDFDITQSDSGGKTRFAVAAGKVVRDGVLQAAVSTANFTQGTPSSFEEPTSGFSYYLLVVNSSNALALKDNGGTILNDIVPNPASTDIPIAVLRLGAGETTTQRHVQFLTTTKNSNSLSIARNNSGYTESATIKSNAGDIEFEALEQDKDIIFKGNDGGASTTIATIDVSDKKLIVPSRIETNLLQLGYGTGNGKVQVYNAGDNLELYAAGDSGGNVKVIDLDAGTDGAEANRIATVSGHLHVSKKTGMGTSSPMNTLQVSHTGADGDNGLMIVREDTTTADTDLLGGIGFDSTDGNVPSSVLEASAYIAALAAEDHGTGDKGADLTFGTAAIDENDDTVSTEHMRILSDGKVGIGENAPDADLHITSSATGNIFILECTDAGVASGPDISMIRNSASPAANDFLGRIVFKGKDADDNVDEYANIKTQLLTPTNGSEDIAYYFQGLIAGTNRAFLGLKGTGGKNGSGAEACINEHGIDMDFRVEANGQTEALFVQGSDGNVGINNNAPSVELDVTGSGKFSSNLEIDGALNHDGSTAGFFGATPITKITVGNIASAAVINPDVPSSATAAEITSTQSAITALENKLDAVIDALQALGLVA